MKRHGPNKENWIEWPCGCQGETAITGQVIQHPDCKDHHSIAPDPEWPGINTKGPRHTK